jgi:hypothetical protein
MPNLTFVSLECHKTDDVSEDDSIFDVGLEDEPYLKVGHKKVWSGRMVIGNVEDLSGVEPIPFEENIRVELWERDSGYVSGQDDLLGYVIIHASQIGHGEVSHKFKRRRARYTLVFKVD